MATTAAVQVVTRRSETCGSGLSSSLGDGPSARPPRYTGGRWLPESVWAFHRRRAMPAQMNSTTPNGQAPDRKPYMLERAHPAANPSTNLRARCSSAYIVIMNVSATTPNAVTATFPVDHVAFVPALYGRPNRRRRSVAWGQGYAAGTPATGPSLTWLLRCRGCAALLVGRATVIFASRITALPVRGRTR